MFMFLRKNKKGFTLIELMVVVAIIGILALLGLRVYSNQQQKAKEAIVRANAGTIQTLIQAELADKAALTTAADGDIDTIFENSQIRNPFVDEVGKASRGVGLGQVQVTEAAGVYTITGYGGTSSAITALTPALTARR